MPSDLYKLCPCGSGKKVKFCCRDIIGDLDRIERMLEGDQRLAGLEKIERLLIKHPDRAALLSLKARIQIVLAQWDEASSTVAVLLEKEPQNPVGPALRAILLVHDGDPLAAARMLQRAWAAAEQTITRPLYEAIYAVAFGFIAQGNVLGARSHFSLLASLSAGKDERAVSMLMELESSEQVPLLFKLPPRLDPCPETVTWKREFEAALQLERRARWLEAAERLEDMSTRILDEPAIVKNLAILRGRLGDTEAAAKAWRAYSLLRGLPLDEAVEAEARAQLLTPDIDPDRLDVIRLVYTVANADRLMERLLSDRRVSRIHIEPQPDPDGNPPPKARFCLLDRQHPPSAIDLQPDQVPLILAEIIVFGRETDRDARVEVVATRDDRFPHMRQQWAEVAGDALGPLQDESRVTQVSALTHLLQWRGQLPSGSTSGQRLALMEQHRRAVMLEQWPLLALSVLDQQTPRAAASQPKYRIPLLAAILILEGVSESHDWDIDFNALRETLNLPTRPRIDPRQTDLDSLPFARYAYLEMDKLSDDDLGKSFEAAQMMGTRKPLRQLAEEILRRPSMEGRVGFIHVHELLSELSADAERALVHPAEARRLGVAQGESPARWLVCEFELYLVQGDIQRAGRLLSEIQARYLKEPGIAQSLMEVLTRVGLMTPDGPALDTVGAEETPSLVAAGAGETTSRLWTPGQESSAPAAREKESKLWVPGMD